MSDPIVEESPIATLFARLAARGGDPILWTPDGETTAAELLAFGEARAAELRGQGIGPGAVCALVGDYSRGTIADLLALVRIGAIAVPLAAATAVEHPGLMREANVEFVVGAQVRRIPSRARHSLVAALAASGRPGLIVFTSGSSGAPKAILHDIGRVASKFVERRPGWRMLLFLQLDHFGGFNSLMSVLMNEGVGVCPVDRSPRAVCEAIAQARVALLPTTPTFLGMLIASGLWRTYDLSSIRLVTYGAEPMPAATLARIREILPSVRFKQTYGLSELGVLRTRSPDPGSLWLKIGGAGFETRVVDGQLHIRSMSSMLGYLNAPTPIDADGWMNTGDLVETRDGLIRFLGRRSELINVGGQKVMPAEVENALLEADGVGEAMAYGVAHLLLGKVVVARVALTVPEDAKAAAQRLRDHCRSRLQKFKVPMRFEFVGLDEISTDRAKKNRSGDS